MSLEKVLLAASAWLTIGACLQVVDWLRFGVPSLRWMLTGGVVEVVWWPSLAWRWIACWRQLRAADRDGERS